MRKGRLPVDKSTRKNKPTGRQAQWLSMRKLNKFTIEEVAKASGQKYDTCRTYIESLIKAGFLENSNKVGLFKHAIFVIKKDNGYHAPRVNRKGEIVEQGSKQQAMWLGMRSMKTFTVPEMLKELISAGVQSTEFTIKDYCNTLVKAGYLALKKKGNSHYPTIYSLVRNTGPKPPMVQRSKQVYDPNTFKVVWRQDADSICNGENET